MIRIVAVEIIFRVLGIFFAMGAIVAIGEATQIVRSCWHFPPNSGKTE